MNELTDAQIIDECQKYDFYPYAQDADLIKCVREIIAADRALRASPPGDAGLPVVQWQKRHPDYDDGAWKNTNEGDAKWWRDSSSLAYEVRELVKQADALAALDVFRENILSKMAIIKSQREEMNQLRADRAQRQAGQEPAEFDDWPEFSQEGMGCGLEDRGIQDRYEAMRYGWDEAIEQVAQRGPFYTAPPPAQDHIGDAAGKVAPPAAQACGSQTAKSDPQPGLLRTDDPQARQERSAVEMLRAILAEVDAEPPSRYTQIDDDLMPELRRIVDAAPPAAQVPEGSEHAVLVSAIERRLICEQRLKPAQVPEGVTVRFEDGFLVEWNDAIADGGYTLTPVTDRSE